MRPGLLLLLGIASFWLVACSAGSEARAAGPDLDIILADKPADNLSDYGLFADASASAPAPGVVGYDLINPLFSDYARKDRYAFIPEGQAAVWHETDVLSFPVGSVLIKSFSYPETGTIETRLLIHKAEGWKGFPYVWNEDRTEAHYSPIGARRTVETVDPDGQMLSIDYAVPNQNQCKTCHQAGDAVTPIGPKARNLGEAQISSWELAGRVIGVPGIFDTVPSVVRGEGALDARARAYLDINCGHCHKANGAASNSGLWLEWNEQDLVKLGIGKHPTAAGRGSGKLLSVIEPGEPDNSILAYRMASVEAGVAMPELGRSLSDEDGLALVRDWILELENN